LGETDEGERSDEDVDGIDSLMNTLVPERISIPDCIQLEEFLILLILH